ncbi:MAG: hypothetical protein QM690_22165 [Sphingobium sp.]
MTATAEDIAAGTREAIIVTWSDQAIKDRFPSARDGEKTPIEGFFDRQADAQAAIDQRGALIGTPRRRFSVRIDGVLWIDLSAGLPAVTLVDSDQAAMGTFMIGRVEVDLEADITTLELYG